MLKSLDRDTFKTDLSYQKQPCLIRHEYFGSLIWSGKRGGYFRAADPNCEEQLQLFLQDPTKYKSSFQGSDIYDEIIALGFDSRVREIKSNAAGSELSAPLEIYFDFTWLCNLSTAKCGQDSFCYAAPFLGNTTMPDEKVSEVLAELYDWGVMRVHLAGGEPTSAPAALMNYLNSARDLGLMTSMSTNGVKISNSLIESMLASELYSITFSIDGYNEDTFAKVRGPGFFENVVKNFRTFRQLRDLHGMQTLLCVKPTIDVGTERSTVDGLIKLAIDLGADVIKFSSPERCLHHEKGHYGSRVDAYYNMAFYVDELKDKYAHQITIYGINNPLTGGCKEIGIPNRTGCIGAQELIALNPNGRVSPCLMHNLDLGRLGHEFSTLRELWENSEKLTDFRQALETPRACNGCELFSSCRSGSVVRRIVEKGKFSSGKKSGDFYDQKDPLCPKEFLDRNSGLKPKYGKEKQAFKHFIPIKVLHSL